MINKLGRNIVSLKEYVLQSHNFFSIFAIVTMVLLLLRGTPMELVKSGLSLPLIDVNILKI